MEQHRAVYYQTLGKCLKKNMTNYYSPLRYPGGKGKIAQFVGLLFETNLLSDGYYVEPYAGGASVGLSLLFKEYVSRIVLNDLDRSIYSFWHSALDETEALCKMITDTKVGVENWRKYREIQKQKSQYTLLELGFSTFYLNRINRSGIIMGGIIGGIGQTGRWKIDARFNKANLIQRIEKIARYKDRIAIYNMDACELIKAITKRIPLKTLLYLDPPYYAKGKDLYVSHYKDQDHKAVAETIKSLKKCSWIVTYDNRPEIRGLYDGFRKIEYSLNYSATQPKQGSEVMIFSDNLYIPEVINPAKLRTRAYVY